jgi:NADH:ubiquinone oxidoreductase subunit D
VRRDEQREAIATAPWDLVIVDEAHHARRTLDGANMGYRLLNELRDRVPGMLLLTATPLQLHEYELYSMVEGANGELGFYVISDGSGKPYRIKVRPPCFPIFSTFPTLINGGPLSDSIVSLGGLNVIAGELER